MTQSLIDVLAAHQYLYGGHHCRCGANVPEFDDMAVHQDEAVAATGLIAIQLPQPAADDPNDFGFGIQAGIGEVFDGDGDNCGVKAARDYAAALLAAAAAAETAERAAADLEEGA